MDISCALKKEDFYISMGSLHWTLVKLSSALLLEVVMAASTIEFNKGLDDFLTTNDIHSYTLFLKAKYRNILIKVMYQNLLGSQEDFFSAWQN